MANILIFSLTWIPYTLALFCNYAFKLDYSSSNFMKTFFLSLIALTPLLYTSTRILCDPSLKQKLMCKKSQSSDKEFNNLMDSLIDQEKPERDTSMIGTEMKRN